MLSRRVARWILGGAAVKLAVFSSHNLKHSDFYDCADTKAHSRDPKPTKLDPNDPKSKQTYVPPAETFEEYMKRRAAGKK